MDRAARDDLKMTPIVPDRTALSPEPGPGGRRGAMKRLPFLQQSRAARAIAGLALAPGAHPAVPGLGTLAARALFLQGHHGHLSQQQGERRYERTADPGRHAGQDPGSQ